MGAIKKEITTVECFDNEKAKAEIEQIKNIISEKIKNPELAKKAAMIIADMLTK